MTDENRDQEGPHSESWAEVERQAKALANSIGSAFQAMWQSEATQKAIDEMHASLKKASSDISSAVDDVLKSSTGQQVRSDAEKAASAAREVGENIGEQVHTTLIETMDTLSQVMKQLSEKLGGSKAAQRDDNSG